MKIRMTHIVKCIVACTGVLLVGVLPQLVIAQDAASQPYMNPKLPAEQRADDLVHRMTLAEKASEMQNNSAAVPRLKIPAYQWWSEALHGVINEGVTEYPEPVGLAATFDAPGIHTMAGQIGIEGRIKNVQNAREGHTGIMGGLDFWSPNLNIFRDPRWGRGQETYGEDPFLTGRMGVAYVTGLQGDDPNYYLAIATPKHYAVHSGPEPTRHFADVDVSRHDELDTYTPAFRAAVVEGKAGSVMCAYNAINGEPACASEFLLQDLLRGKWGFQGYVVSDCGAIKDVAANHRYRSNQAQGAAIWQSTDLDLGKLNNFIPLRFLPEGRSGFAAQFPRNSGIAPTGLSTQGQDPRRIAGRSQRLDTNDLTLAESTNMDYEDSDRANQFTAAVTRSLGLRNRSA